MRRQQRLSARYPGRSIAPGDMVETARFAWLHIVITQAMERPPGAERTVRQRLADPLDTPHLSGTRPARIGHDAIFGVGMAKGHGLAALGEQIDQWRAAKRQ